MSQPIVRNLDPRLVNRLKQRATAWAFRGSGAARHPRGGAGRRGRLRTIRSVPVVGVLIAATAREQA